MGLFAWDRYVIPQALIVRPAARPSSFGTGQHRPCPNLYSTAETLYVWNLFIRSLTLASCTFCCAISGQTFRSRLEAAQSLSLFTASLPSVAARLEVRFRFHASQIKLVAG